MAVKRNTIEFRLNLYEAVCSYIKVNYSKDIGLDDCSRFLEISRRSIQRAIQEQGTTWQSMLREVRVNHAAEMLRETDIAAHRICTFVGYRQPAHFAKAFRSVYGLSPIEYRNQQRRWGNG